MPQTLKNNPFFHCDSSLIKLNQHHLHAMKKWETCKNSRHKTCDISVEPSTKIRVATIQLRTTQPFTNTAQTEPPTSIMASLTLRESSSPTMSEQESSCCWALVSQSTQALWRCRKFSWSSMFFSECSTCSCHTRVHSCFLLLCFHSCTRHLTALSPFFQPCTRHSTTFFSFFFLFFFFLPPTSAFCSCLNKHCEHTTAARIYTRYTITFSTKCITISQHEHLYQSVKTQWDYKLSRTARDNRFINYNNLKSDFLKNKTKYDHSSYITFSTRPA